uniref:dCMP deaminase n=1 Tax=Sparus aurata TaxID=8175 RepID=A0A671XA67_SPAAU
LSQVDFTWADYLEKEYFMTLAKVAAQRSKDPNTQVGACIVNQEKKIVGIGYNSMPNGCDGQLTWTGSEDGFDWPDTKYPYVCHAELNAIMNKNSADVKGCTIYVTLLPCNECAKLTIQAGRCLSHTHTHTHAHTPSINSNINTDFGANCVPTCCKVVQDKECFFCSSFFISIFF